MEIRFRSGTTLQTSRLPVCVRKMLAILDALPDGDVLTGYDLAAELGFTTHRSVQAHQNNAALNNYTVTVPIKNQDRRFFANPRTIAYIVANGLEGDA